MKLRLANTTNVQKDSPPRFSERYRRHKASWSTTLNLTPMIDVVFLLLFFFLVVSRFGAEGMLPARLPTAAASVFTDIPRSPLRVRFTDQTDEAGQTQVTIDRFERGPLPIAALTGALRIIREEQPGFDADTPVHLIAEDDASWQDIVNAYNASLGAGYRKVFFVDSQ